jgi:DNA-binding transcriptional regulator GbsR (MarR family)
MKKYIESISQLEIAASGLVVRVWREENSYDTLVPDDTWEVLNDCLIEKITTDIAKNKKAIADILFEVDRVNAVEVKDKHGNGIVLYKDWP